LGGCEPISFHGAILKDFNEFQLQRKIVLTIRIGGFVSQDAVEI
jgi:hypothetical protein